MKPSDRAEIDEKSKSFEGFYVYLLIDPRDNSIFYVGKGKGRRVWNHFSKSYMKNENSRKRNKINSINNSGYKVIVRVLLNNLSDESALNKEFRLIKYFDGKFDLTNQMKSKEDVSRYKIYQEKRKINKDKEDLIKLFKLRFMYERIDFRDLVKEEPFCSSGFAIRTMKSWILKNSSNRDYLVSECPTQKERMVENIVLSRKMRDSGTSIPVIMEILNIPESRVKQYLKDSTLKRYGVFDRVMEELSNGTFKRL